MKLLSEEVDDLCAADDAIYAPSWGIAGEATALGEMRKAPSPSFGPEAQTGPAPATAPAVASSNIQRETAS